MTKNIAKPEIARAPKAPTPAASTPGQGALVRNFVFIIAAFVVPLLAAAGYFAVVGFGKDIAFTEQEKLGIAYLDKLEPVLKTIEEEKNLVLRHVSESVDDREAIKNKRDEVKKALDDLDAIDALDGQQLEFTEEGLKNSQRADVRPSKLREQWEALESTSQTTVSAATMPDVQKKYDALIANVETAITHAGDKSNLILDPDLDAYYMMDIVVAYLPPNQDRLTSIETFLEEQAIAPSADAKNQAIAFAALLQTADIANIDQAAITTVASNKNPTAAGTGRPAVQVPDLQATYPQAQQKYDAPNNKLVDALNAYAAMATPGPTTISDLLTLTREAREQSFALGKESSRQLAELLRTKEEAIKTNRNTILAYTLGALVIASIMAYFLISRQVRSYTSYIVNQGKVELERSRAIQAQLDTLLDVLFEASEGKLTVKAPVTEGELGSMSDALNLMIANTRQVLTSFKTSATKLEGAAKNLADNAKSLNSNAQSQTEKTNQSMSQVSELTMQANEVLKNTEVGQSAAVETRKSAEEGVQLINQLSQSIVKLRDSAQSSGKKVKRLSESTLEIFTAASSIRAISERIDMAALNSKMAAARAGAAGQEFGVVAQNIADLSESTKKFTNNIETLIKNVQAETSEVVRLTEEQTQEVARGAQSSELTKDAFDRIMRAANESAKLVQEINKTASVQASKAQEMLGSFSQVQMLTLATETQSSETQKTSDELSQLAVELKTGLASFEV